MANVSVLYLLFVLGFFPEGVKSVIQTQQTVMAAVGDEACFSCQIMQSKDVLQVTWQIILPEGEKNLATCNKFFGQRVNHDFRDKMEFKDAGLQNSSLVIKKVTEQDEGCYRCLFNTYPDGALSARTCLQVYELHEPILHVRESNSTEESVVSCSATGRPAPTVTLTVTQQDLYFSHYNTVSVNNTNGTVTVTTTAVLSGFHGSSTQVGCAVRVLSGPQKEVFMMIPEVKQTSADGFDKKHGSDNSGINFTWIVVLILVVICGLAAVIFFLHKQTNKIRDPEKNKTPQKRGIEINEIVTPLIQKVNEQIKQRTSVKKSPLSDRPKSSPSTAKCLEKLFDQS